MIRRGIPPSLRCAVWLSGIIQSCRSDEDLTVVHEYRTLSKVRVVDSLYESLWEGDEGNSANERPATSILTQISKQDVQRRADLGVARQQDWEIA